MRGRPVKTEHFSKKSAGSILWRIAVYIRLSREDGNAESESVVNQKKILTEYLQQFFQGQYVIVDFYIEPSHPKRNEVAKKRPRTCSGFRWSACGCGHRLPAAR